jgi:hypothetical protein
MGRFRESLIPELVLFTIFAGQLEYLVRISGNQDQALTQFINSLNMVKAGKNESNSLPSEERQKKSESESESESNKYNFPNTNFD